MLPQPDLHLLQLAVSYVSQNDLWQPDRAKGWTCYSRCTLGCGGITFKTVWGAASGGEAGASASSAGDNSAVTAEHQWTTAALGSRGLTTNPDIYRYVLGSCNIVLCCRCNVCLSIREKKRHQTAQWYRTAEHFSSRWYLNNRCLDLRLKCRWRPIEQNQEEE